MTVRECIKANPKKDNEKLGDYHYRIADMLGVNHTSVRRTYAKYFSKSKNKESNRVLFIGDIHEPFCRPGYRKFCYDLYKKWSCNTVIFAGDILDNHYSSYHETDPDGHAAGTELAIAKDNINKWYRVFPKAKVCIGNHDSLPNRRAMTAGLSAKWIKTIKEVVEVPGWDFDESFIVDGVLYCHGIGRKAYTRSRQDMISVVQGHYHADSYIKWTVGKRDKIFACQVGCGMDDKTFAAAYGKHFQKMHINAAVIIDGKLPILEYMEL
jgi:predicted phosphodiesterase